MEQDTYFVRKRRDLIACDDKFDKIRELVDAHPENICDLWVRVIKYD